jgi:hypothetical protein
MRRRSRPPPVLLSIDSARSTALGTVADQLASVRAFRNHEAVFAAACERVQYWSNTLYTIYGRDIDVDPKLEGTGFICQHAKTGEWHKGKAGAVPSMKTLQDPGWSAVRVTPATADALIERDGPQKPAPAPEPGVMTE